MESFEDLGVADELVEALAAEGIERPTPLQAAAVPVLRKGNNLVLAAGPGSGLLVAWSVGLLERIEVDDAPPRLLVLSATREAADRLAESTARIALSTGHAVAALGASWVLPARAHVLFATPQDVLSSVAEGALALANVRVVVVDQAQMIESLGGLADVERVLDYLDAETQRVVSALPVTSGVSDLVERHVKRAVTIPPPPVDAAPDRGEVRFRIVAEPREAGTLAVVAELLAGGARHVLVFCRSEDRAADVGDFLALHGFGVGAPGDGDAPVWLGVDALEARGAAKGTAGLVVVSADPPAGPDDLDRRHSISEGGVVVVLPRELPHLKSLGRATGYRTVPYPPPPPPRSAVAELRDMLERALAEEDTAPYLAALEPLIEEHDPAQVAAAAVALLRSQGRQKAAVDRRPAETPTRPAAVPAWAKLFFGIGERDGVRPGDLVGAITGEAGVGGDAVGRIEVRESHSLVEVHDAVARKVIRAINGTTIKGRAVRVDFDRPRRGPPKRGRPPGRPDAPT